MADENVESNQSNLRRWWRWGLAAVVGVAVLGVWGWMEGPPQGRLDQVPVPTHQREDAAPPSAAAPRNGLAQDASRATPGPTQEATAPAPQAHTPGGGPVEPPREYLGSRDYIRRKLLAANKDLADYKYFEEKVLRTQAETQSFQSMLASTERLGKAFERLAAPTEKEFSDEAELERMYQVDYLEQALRWKENPEREKVLDLTERIILADTLSPELPLELRRSRAGDKLELFKVLQEVAAERARRTVERARGTRVAKILALAGPGTTP